MVGWECSYNEEGIHKEFPWETLGKLPLERLGRRMDDNIEINCKVVVKMGFVDFDGARLRL
jgi:hypothetical protein